jgi:hypothetical protein
MASAEADRWEARVDVVKVIVVVRHTELASIFAGVAIGMTNQ